MRHLLLILFVFSAFFYGCPDGGTSGGGDDDSLEERKFLVKITRVKTIIHPIDFPPEPAEADTITVVIYGVDSVSGNTKTLHITAGITEEDVTGAPSINGLKAHATIGGSEYTSEVAVNLNSDNFKDTLYIVNKDLNTDAKVTKDQTTFTLRLTSSDPKSQFNISPSGNFCWCNYTPNEGENPCSFCDGSL